MSIFDSHIVLLAVFVDDILIASDHIVRIHPHEATGNRTPSVIFLEGIALIAYAATREIGRGKTYS